MPRIHLPYPAEFKVEAVRFARIVERTAKGTNLAAIDARLGRYRERRAGDEDTAQLRTLLADWRAIGAVRDVHEAARPAPVGAGR